ncbi:hypothetical protein FRC02_009971 [Tulasnella sp. 418]|nr:hypothetical protein FRC02_009971 [Tulasnella sp. 418]
MSSSQRCTPQLPTTSLPEESDHERTDSITPQCRICFLTSAEAPDLAPLISPCDCKGSMQYVHSGCINKWRGTSGSKEDFWSCTQCRAQYRFAKRWTLPINLALNPAGRALFAISTYIVIAVLLSEIVSRALSSSPEWFILKGIKTCLRVGVEGFVWGGKSEMIPDWKAIFALNDVTAIVARRFLVGIAFIGILESFIRAPLLAVLIYPVVNYTRPRPDSFSALTTGSVMFLYIAWGIILSMLQLIEINSRLAWMVYYRAVREVVDKDDERVGSIPRP